MTPRTLLLAALASLPVSGCVPALVEFPRERTPQEAPSVFFELPDAPGPVEPDPRGVITATDTGVTDPVGEGAGTAVGVEDQDPWVDPADTEASGETQCGVVTSQSGWCASLRDEAGVGAVVGFVGLDDGLVCDAVVADVGTSTLTATSLALGGTGASWCDGANVVHTVDLLSGQVTTSTSTSMTCAAVTSAMGGLAVLPQGLSRDVTWFADVDELLSGAGVRWPVRPWASRLAADSSLVYAAWHETDMIERWQPTGVELEPLELDWFGFLYGLDSVDGDRLVVLDEARDLRVFDAVTGDTLDQIPLSGAWSGLACFPEP